MLHFFANPVARRRRVDDASNDGCLMTKRRSTVSNQVRLRLCNIRGPSWVSDIARPFPIPILRRRSQFSGTYVASNVSPHELANTTPRAPYFRNSVSVER
ncbi:protein of unknown function (plasmid) [Pararobbsia alpina]